MSDKIISTVEQLEQYLKTHLSEKRYKHSLGVADTTDRILKHYNLKADEEKYLDFEAAVFCGLAHDIAREFTDSQILDYCKTHGLKLNDDELKFPVLAHGLVSANMAIAMCGNYPVSWYKAISEHTTGDAVMDSLSLALFCADYLEPSRTYLTDEKRAYYLSSESLEECAYRILCDMMNHWKEKGNHISCAKSNAMKAHLEEVI